MENNPTPRAREIAEKIVASYLRGTDTESVPFVDTLKECITSALQSYAGEKELPKNHERLLDLVRYMRVELHREELITDDEYEALLSINSSRERLESYDQVRARLTAAEAKVEKMEKWLHHTKECYDDRCGFVWECCICGLSTFLQSVKEK